MGALRAALMFFRDSSPATPPWLQRIWHYASNSRYFSGHLLIEAVSPLSSYPDGSFGRDTYWRDCRPRV